MARTRSQVAPDAPYTVADLCALLGWSKPTVLAALKTGLLPGYQHKAGGKWTIPAVAYRAVADGTWQPQPKPIVATSEATEPLKLIHAVTPGRKEAA
jgi:hypothetical protein